MASRELRWKGLRRSDRDPATVLGRERYTQNRLLSHDSTFNLMPDCANRLTITQVHRSFACLDHRLSSSPPQPVGDPCLTTDVHGSTQMKDGARCRCAAPPRANAVRVNRSSSLSRAAPAPDHHGCHAACLRVLHASRSCGRVSHVRRCVASNFSQSVLFIRRCANARRRQSRVPRGRLWLPSSLNLGLLQVLRS